MSDLSGRSPVEIQKSILRKRMSIWREGISNESINAQSVSMSKLLLDLICNNQDYFRTVKNSNKPCLGLYNSFRQEADFSSIWLNIQKMDWDISFPLMKNSNSMSQDGRRGLVFIRAPIISSANNYDLQSWFTHGHFGVNEPPDHLEFAIEPDLIVLPGLAFDNQGNRLGWGKAYYDSYLAARMSDRSSHYPLTLGAALDGQMIDVVPSSEHDIAVAGIITPTEIVKANQFPIELIV